MGSLPFRLVPYNHNISFLFLPTYSNRNMAVPLHIVLNLFLARFDLHCLFKLLVPLTSDNWGGGELCPTPVHAVHLEGPLSLGCPGPQYPSPMLQESTDNPWVLTTDKQGREERGLSHFKLGEPLPEPAPHKQALSIIRRACFLEHALRCMSSSQPHTHVKPGPPRESQGQDSSPDPRCQN